MLSMSASQSQKCAQGQTGCGVGEGSAHCEATACGLCWLRVNRACSDALEKRTGHCLLHATHASALPAGNLASGSLSNPYVYR